MVGGGTAGTDHDRGLRIVVADDDAEMRGLLRDVLEHEGFRVREESGEGLVLLLEDWEPDAIVLDKEMGGMNWRDRLSYVRHLVPRTPVVLVTAFGGAEVQAEALRLGAAYYLDKPFRVGRLLEVLRALLGRSKGGSHPG